MKITFSNAALTIVIEDENDNSDVIEVLEALKPFRVTEVNHNAPTLAAAPAAAPVAEVAAEAPAAEPVAEVTAATEPTLQSVYGPGFTYGNEEDNPSLGFRQPVVGDIFLDPDVMAPRRKVTATEFGPRLILSYR